MEDLANEERYSATRFTLPILLLAFFFFFSMQAHGQGRACPASRFTPFHLLLARVSHRKIGFKKKKKKGTLKNSVRVKVNKNNIMLTKRKSIFTCVLHGNFKRRKKKQTLANLFRERESTFLHNVRVLFIIVFVLF